MKEFAKKNFRDIVFAGLLAVVALLALAWAALSPSGPAPAGEQGPFIQTPAGRISVRMGGCEPFFNDTLADFSYNVVAQSPLGYRSLVVSQEFAGYDAASGLVILRVRISGEGNAVDVIKYLDAESGKCRKQVLAFGGRLQAADCAEATLFENACAERMREEGGGSVRVPVGEFNATAYRDALTNVSYWVAEGVAVPVKFSAQGMNAELAGYRRINRTW